MTRLPTRARRTRRQLTFLAVAAAFAAASTGAILLRPARAQLASWTPPIPPENAMTLVRAGTFEVWHKDRLLGTEEYKTWRTPTADTLVAISVCQYDLDSDPDSAEYAKQTIQLTKTIDQMPLYFQVMETAGDAVFTGSVSFRDTLAQVYHENLTGGKAWTLTVPEGKLFVLDPGTYQLVEFLLGDFARRGIPGRSHRVFVLRTRETLEVDLTNDGEETVEWPKGASTNCIVAQMTDGVTSFKGWFDKEGRLLILDAPSYETRIVRRAD